MQLQSKYCFYHAFQLLFQMAGYSTANEQAVAMLSVAGTLISFSFLASLIIDKVG